MDIRIHSEGLDGSSALQTSRTQETSPVGQGERRRGSNAVGGGQDSVQISGLSAQISAANQQQDVQSADRVAALAALYSRGNYRVDARTLSRSLVSHALSGAVEGGVA